MAKLDKVISDFFICQGLIRFGEFDEVVVQIFKGFVLRWIGLNFVRVELEGKLFVVRLNRLLVKRLKVGYVSYTSDC